MSNLDVKATTTLTSFVKKAILDKVNSYLNIDECNLDLKEFETLKKTFDALWTGRPLDNECRIYVKTVAADKIYEGLNSLMEQMDDNPKLKNDVSQILIWYHIAKDI